MSLPELSHEQDTTSSRPGTHNGNHLPLPKQIRFISHDSRPYAKREEGEYSLPDMLETKDSLL
jgi:hypothetical protein